MKILVRLYLISILWMASTFCADVNVKMSKVSSSTKSVNGTVFNTKCPPDMYPCSTDGPCLNLTMFCDNTKHCNDSSNEAAICDKHLSQNYEKNFLDNEKKQNEFEQNHCELDNIYEKQCQCSKKTVLKCRHKSMTTFFTATSTKVTDLDLTANKFIDVTTIDFQMMPNLTTLNLNQNRIYCLQNDTFRSASNLESLYLGFNQIVKIEVGSLTGMYRLSLLDLQGNLITDLNIEIFKDLKELKYLNLGNNKLTILKDGVFDSLTKLLAISLNGNELTHIEPHVFKYLTNVHTLDLRYNKLQSIENGAFQNMHRLTYVHFDRFYMCLYASHVQVCHPQGDGISSKENLLESMILRVSVWIVGLFACFGNLLVVLGRFFTKEDNRIHSFFIQNLSMADLLMGIYLLIIGVQDIKYRGKYIFYDKIWRNSWGCDFSGMLSTLSTEMSVLTLSIITLDRYIIVMYPMSNRKRGLKLSYCIMILTWAVCIFLATLPFMGQDYFGGTFYRDNAVCVPLHLHDPRVQGWEFSTFLFIGINFGCFGFIAYAYVAMFYFIHWNALPLRTSRESRERWYLVQRFFFIVITDFLCLVPIIIIKILVLGGVEITNDLYAWLAVFILPVNSALNPMLYTLTTKLFKKQIFTSALQTQPGLRQRLHPIQIKLKKQRTLNREENAVP